MLREGSRLICGRRSEGMVRLLFSLDFSRKAGFGDAIMTWWVRRLSFFLAHSREGSRQ